MSMGNMARRLKRQRYHRVYPDTPAPALLKVLLLMVITVGMFVAGGYGYYATNVANQLPCSPGFGLSHSGPHAGRCSPIDPLTGRPDPFAVFWDGQVPPTYTTFQNGYYATQKTTNCATSCATPSQGIQAGDFLIAYTFCNNGQYTGISDSQGSAWTYLGTDNVESKVWYTTAATGGGDVVTVTGPGGTCHNAFGDFGVLQVAFFHGIAGIAAQGPLTQTFPTYNQTACAKNGGATCFAHATQVVTSYTYTGTISVSAGELIIVDTGMFCNNAFGGCGSITVSDSQGNGYFQWGMICDNSSVMCQAQSSGYAGATGTLTYTITVSNNLQGVSLESASWASTYDGVAQVGVSHLDPWEIGQSNVQFGFASPFSWSSNIVSYGSMMGAFVTNRCPTSSPVFSSGTTTMTVGFNNCNSSSGGTQTYGMSAMNGTTVFSTGGAADSWTWTQASQTSTMLRWFELRGCGAVMEENGGNDLRIGTASTQDLRNCSKLKVGSSQLWYGFFGNTNTSAFNGCTWTPNTGQLVDQTWSEVVFGNGNFCGSAGHLNPSGSQNPGPYYDSLTAHTDNSAGPQAWGKWAIQLIFGGQTGCTGSQTQDFSGYLCSNSQFSSGFLDNLPNATSPGIALSRDTVDLSQCAAKACAFSMAVCWNQGGCPGTLAGDAAGDRFAWFLTVNGTLPSQAGYNPINDKAVVLMVYIIREAADKAHVYLMMQRQPGQALATSGGDDPCVNNVFNCNNVVYTATLFRAMNVPVNFAGGSNGMNAVLNFTGGNTGNSGTSYFCGGSVAAGPNTCNVGGKGTIADANGGTISYPGYLFNQTLFPWMSIQNHFHVGFWAKAGNVNTPGWQVPQNNLGGIISYFVPPTSPASATTDTGGFFGWMGRSLSGAWNTLSGVGSTILGAVAGPVLNFGNSLLSAFITAISTAFTVMAVGFQVMLNSIGSIWGDNLLGTHIFTFLQSIVNTVVDIFSIIATLAAQIFNFFFVIVPFLIGNFLQLFVTIANSIWVIVIALFPLIIAFGGIINMPLQSLFFFDYVFGLTAVFFNGTQGFVSWLRLNLWFFTIGFKTFDWLISKILWLIRSVKQLIPVIG